MNEHTLIWNKLLTCKVAMVAVFFSNELPTSSSCDAIIHVRLVEFHSECTKLNENIMCSLYILKHNR